MSMKKLFIICGMFAFTCAARAQVLNPQVQVTNIYQSTGSDVLKQDLPLSLPDSVMQINYNFDYSVFETPYKGAYEFSPYVIEVVPDKTPWSGGNLFVRAGAGYGLHPELKAAYSPDPKGKFSFSIGQDFSGYYGNYWQVAPNMGIFNKKYPGYDLSEKISAYGRWSNEKSNLSWRAGYRGLYNEDNLYSSAWHSIEAVACLAGNEGGNELNVHARYSRDNISHEIDNPFVDEFEAGIDGTIRFGVPGHNGRINADYALDLWGMPYVFSDKTALTVSVSPHYELSLPFARFLLGFKLEYFGKPVISPDVRISARLAEKWPEIYAGVSGGNAINTYSSLKEYDHFFNPAYTTDFGSVRRERYKFFAGIGGHISSRLSFKAEAGYLNIENNPFETVKSKRDVLLPGIVFADCRMAYAGIDASWKSERFFADAHVKFIKAGVSDAPEAVGYPLASADMVAEYNLRNRFHIGATVRYESSRQLMVDGTDPAAIPQFFDLGAYLEYRMNGKWSFWLKGCNLLNNNIHISPLHVDQGINFTAGVCLSL